MFYFHPYLGKIPILTSIFQMGWNHQLGYVEGIAYYLNLAILADIWDIFCIKHNHIELWFCVYWLFTLLEYMFNNLCLKKLQRSGSTLCLKSTSVTHLVPHIFYKTPRHVLSWGFTFQDSRLQKFMIHANVPSESAYLLVDKKHSHGIPLALVFFDILWSSFWYWIILGQIKGISMRHLCCSRESIYRKWPSLFVLPVLWWHLIVVPFWDER